MGEDNRFCPCYFANGSNVVGIYGCFEKMNALSNLSNLSMICLYEPNSTDIANYDKNNHSFTAYFPNKNVSVSLSVDTRNFTENGTGILFNADLDDTYTLNETVNMVVEYEIDKKKRSYYIATAVFGGLAAILGGVSWILFGL